MNMNDLKNMAVLWHTVFGDREEEAMLYLSRYTTPDNHITILKDNRVVGMAHHPAFSTPQGLTVNYLYAVCVIQEMRGKGMAHRMIHTLLNAGSNAIASVTIPADEGLRRWYAEQFGYRYPAGEPLLRFHSDYDFGSGNHSQDVMMVRITNAARYLAEWASHNPDAEERFSITDSIIPGNNIGCRIAGGKLLTEAKSAENAIDIADIYTSHPLEINDLTPLTLI